jgi:NAD(P)-dependent dehydrogenase (short-subunit alcohol dehydrogenase family)
MKEVRGRVVLVTGASSGIGACCAAYLSERGYRVYGASRRITAPPNVVPLAMDVTNDASVSQAITTVLAREGRLDVLVNNAGFGIAGAVEDTSVEEAVAQFDVNFFGMFRVCRAVLPVLRRQGAGYIINIGSIGGLIAIPYQGFYSASKFALEGLSESLRLEVKPFGIHVVLIEPGDHHTTITQNRRSTEVSARGSVYRDRFERAIARMASDEQGGPTPDGIAHLLYKVINHPNPRLRYTVGPAAQRAAVWMKRLLPNAVIERIMRNYYVR